jgi:hypothetical protein
LTWYVAGEGVAVRLALHRQWRWDTLKHRERVVQDDRVGIDEEGSITEL